MPQSYKPPRIFHLRSQDATIKGLAPYQQSDLYFNIDQNMTPQSDEALVVSLNTAEIPISFYPIGVNNNTIKWSESTDATVGNLVAKNNIVLTDGNYTAVNLAIELQAKLIASNGENDYTVSFTNATGKFAIHKNAALVGGVAEKAFELDFSIASSGTAYRTFGYTSSKVQSVKVGATAKTTLVGTVVANVGGDNAVYVRCPLSNINSFESKHGGTSDILAKIPITGQYNEIQHYSPVANMFKSQLPNGQPLNDLTIRLTNSDNLLLDMNGMDWEMSIVVEVIKIN